jgi:hypothetical protein
MKLSLHMDKTRKPRRSIKELADEFGVTTQQLAAFLGKDPDGPKPVLKAKGTVGNSWYDPSAVRKWWHSRQSA